MIQSIVDDALARSSFPNELAPTMQEAARRIATFYIDLVARNGSLEVRQIYNQETTWRKHHPKIDHPRLRRLILIVRELAVPHDYMGIDAIGPLNDYRPTPSPLSYACIAGAQLADRLEERYIAWRLALPRGKLTPDLAVAEIIFLCAYRGGMVLDDELNALAHAPLPLLLGEKIAHGDELMSEAWIVPPPEAGLALRAFQQRHPEYHSLLPRTQKIAALMPAFVAELDPTIGGSEWLDAAQHRARRDAPDWLVALMLEEVTDTAALPSSRARLLSGLPQLVSDRQVERPDEQTAMPWAATTPSADLPAAPATSTAYLSDLRRALLSSSPYPSDRASVLVTLERLRDKAPDTLCWLLAALVMHWLSHPNPPKPRSVARYLSALLHLPRVAGLQVPFVRRADGTWQADAACWENIMILAADPRWRSDLSTPKALFRLHQFAAQHFLALEECDLEDIQDFNFPHHARAIIVSDEEMSRAVTRMQSTEPTLTGPCLLAEVAYAAGPRLRELTHARLSDLRVLNDGRLVLEIRSHRDRALKRPSSRRDIPLHALLTPDQLRRLRIHVKALHALGMPPTKTYLFATLDQPSVPPSRTHCYVLIGILRELTGDKSISFHSLRHSAANWIMLQMLCWEIPGIALLPVQGLDPQRFAPEAVRALVLALCPEAASAPRGRLPATWTQSLARLLGHSSPRTSLHDYLHLRPLYQAWVLARDLMVMPSALIALLADVPERTLRRHIARWKATALSSLRNHVTAAQTLWVLHHGALQKDVRRQHVHTGVINEVGVKGPLHGSLRIAAIPRVSLLGMSAFPAEDTATAFGCPIQTVQRVYDAQVRRTDGAIYAPALKLPLIPRRREDLSDFRSLARALDRDHGTALEHEALSRFVDAEKRWALDSEHDGATVLGFLFRVLPKDAVVYVELQAIAESTANSMTTEQREHRWRALIDDAWGDRLKVIAWPQSKGPTWRDRPKPRGPGPWIEWAHLRVGKLPWPEGPKNFERCTGYTRALHCLRVLYDLRTPAWRLYRW